MRTSQLMKITGRFQAVLLALGLVGLTASSAAAQMTTVHLIAAPLTKTVTLPNGTLVSVPMWGFALDADQNGILDTGEVPTVPGPRISVAPGDTTLQVWLTNTLADPVSIIVLGQKFDATVVRNGGRVVSMTKETAPGATVEYLFTDLKPGTFLYESGTHQAVQVQMGLYGAVTQDAVAGEAYAGMPYAHEALLLYSEIDVALHQAVNDGTYGVAGMGPTSTINYKPSFFLINGESYTSEASPAIAAGVAGETTLLRLLNAGLDTHAPLIDNGLLSIVAEDGNPYPLAKSQAAVQLAAGKTSDVLWTPPAAAVYRLYDRMLSLNAAGQAPGGMIARLSVTSAAADPVTADDDAYVTAEDTALAIAAPGVLDGDVGTGLQATIVAGTHAGSLMLMADGSFTYTPDPDFFGVDSFTYTATDGMDTSLPATVTITVSPVDDAPVAQAQEVGLDARTSAHVTLAGSDPDGDALTFTVTALPANGALSYIDATSTEIPIGAVPAALPATLVIYTPEPTVPYDGTDSFEFAVSDGATQSAAAAVTAVVHALEADPTPPGADLAINIVASDGTPITEYKWTLEADDMYEVMPGVFDPDTLSVRFHSSYMQVLQSGDEGTAPKVEAGKRYFLSVLPKSGGYSNSGAHVDYAQNSVTIRVDPTPMPTAQVYVRVFHDNAPLNGVWDTGELGLEGFEVALEDGGGRYGMSAGDMMFDTFGNPIGTVYGECTAEAPATCDSYEVVSYGSGFVLTDADGWALIKNLAPGKYGVKVRSRGGEAWQQTSTIEGTRILDAWVKPNEPQFFMEFGPPGPHAEVGFVQKTIEAAVIGAGVGPFSEISGRVTNLHMARPPDPTQYSGATFDFTNPWVALNTGAAGGTLIYAQPVDPDTGEFTISGVPSGSYQLWVFDSALNIIIASKVINVSAPDAMPLGDVSVHTWFTRSYNYVFEDLNENGFRDPGEKGIPETAVNIRWRDGTMNQSSATDGSGFVPFEETFPFFHWQVMEVDYVRDRATGVTVVVDDGGDPTLDTMWPATVGAEVDSAVLKPQPQSENGGAGYRTETGPVLLEAFQGFIGQSHVLLWGKAPYREAGSVASDVDVAPFGNFPGDEDIDGNSNGIFDVDQYLGGITGIVHYSTTRAENDPRWGGAEPWEPGIPRVRVQLWDKTRTHLLSEVTTDSWDDSPPVGCQGEVFMFAGSYPKDCYDGLRNFNQVRPGLFDGGYAFYTIFQDSANSATFNLPLEARAAEVPLPAGEYVVKVVPPAGYQVVKEEDKNVDFGIEWVPQQFWLTGYALGDGGPAEAPPVPTVEEYPLSAPFCVGTLREVGPELSLFPGLPGAYAGDQRPLCDAKLVNARHGSNAAANFFLFTEAPIAGHIVGFVLDDTTNEFDPNSPQFGEKYAPPFMPVAIRDWRGREITRTYTDAYGHYNVMVPSTFTANAPMPSGMSPNMLTACINAPLKADGSVDPLFQKQYSHFCYTLQYMPGATTYLDTPVVPTAAFTGADVFPVDAELPNQTPTIARVTNEYLPSGMGTGITAAQIGPYVVDRGAGPVGSPNELLRTITISAAGDVQVPNPLYAGATTGGGVPKLITRDYGFGTNTSNGIVRLGGLPITVTSWTNSTITAIVPTGMTFRTGQLSVERCLTGTKALGATTCPGASSTSVLGVTLSVATNLMHSERPPVVLVAGQTIQSAIDAASPGDLLLVPPGVYNEMVVMSRPVRLQGWGASATTINTVQVPAEGLQTWRDYVGSLLTANPDYLLAGQLNILGPPPYGPGIIAAATGGEGAGVTVFGRDLPTQTKPAGNSGNLVETYRCLGTFAAPTNEAYCLQNENETWADPRVSILDVWRDGPDSGGAGLRVVHVATAEDHTFSAGNLVNIAGVNPAAYTGDKIVVSVVSATEFTYTVPNTAADLNPPILNATAQRVFTIASISRSGAVVTVNTIGSHGFATGDHVTIGGITPGSYNGDKIITVTGGTSFTYPGNAGGPPPNNQAGTARLTPPPPGLWLPNARIDGVSVIGASNEAGVFVNGHAHFLQVSNDRIFNNLGNFGGGVRVGHPAATLPLADENADNGGIVIQNNWIAQNAGLDGGGGVVLGTGSNNYSVRDNWISANFTSGWGAGVTHLGLSPGGVIDGNRIVFNESFNQGLTRSGAGIFVGGRQPIAAEMTPGSGAVRISNNLIQGNQSAGGDGGGIALQGVNGQDILTYTNPLEIGLRYGVSIYNNIIANNVAALAGGGISLQDAAYVDIVHNTIVHNDSLATAGAAFTAGPNTSVAQPAGIVSRGHTPLLATALGAAGFSNPRLANTIVWENRSFIFGPLPGGVIGPDGGTYGLSPAATPYWDLGVLGASAGSALNPQYSVLTSTAGYAGTNSSAAPAFVATYFNGPRNPAIIPPDGTPGIAVPAAFDEGGNFIRPQFGPLSLFKADGSRWGDYHVGSGVVGQGLNAMFGGAGSVPATLLMDYDRQARPQATPHRGADQAATTTAPAPAPAPDAAAWLANDTSPFAHALRAVQFPAEDGNRR